MIVAGQIDGDGIGLLMDLLLWLLWLLWLLV